LPVQFNVFAFLPDVLGGVNAFLDPEAGAKRKQTGVCFGGTVSRHPLAGLGTSLTSPAFRQHLWTCARKHDGVELQKDGMSG